MAPFCPLLERLEEVEEEKGWSLQAVVSWVDTQLCEPVSNNHVFMSWQLGVETEAWIRLPSVLEQFICTTLTLFVPYIYNSYLHHLPF